LPKGLKALEAFLRRHITTIKKDLHSFIIKAAQAVLSENYIEAAPFGIYQQTQGTAMGTSFAVVYAIIYMIEFETPIIEKFAEDISLYGRFIDDAQTIWIGSESNKKAFIQALQTTDPDIKWTISEHTEASPFLDVETLITLKNINNQEVWGFTHKVYRKELNAYAYLPYASYHGKHIPKAWIKAELYRLNSLSTKEEDFNTAKKFFLKRLAARGYPIKLLKEMDTHYTRHTIEQERAQPKSNNMAEKMEKQNGCILSVARVPYIQETLRAINVDPKRIENASLRDFYPEKPIIVFRNAPSMSRLLAKCRKYNATPKAPVKV
jgi:hypothetical protein